jgi:hypothetical protein
MKTGHLPSALAGLALWLLSSGASGRREPWDAPEFWSQGYPAAIALAALLGVLWPRQSWLWGFIVMGMMTPVMAWSGSGLGLLPLGLALLTVLALPASLAGLIAGRLRRALSRA